MSTLHEKIHVDRKLREVFDYIADFRTTEQWDSTVVSARKLDSGAIRQGTRFEVVCRQPLGTVTLLYTLTHLDTGGLIRLHGTSRFFDVEDEIRLSETGSGTHIDYRATFTFRAPLKAFEKRFLPGLERMGHASVQGLKRALDDDFPAPQLSPSSRIAEKLVLPEIARFTRLGYTRGKKTWQPVSRWMGDQHVVITGASSGLGLAAALRLAELGATLTLVIRDESRAIPLKRAIERQTGNTRVHIEIADLALMADVDRLVRRMLHVGKTVDVLINNAGALFNPRGETAEGLEQSFALLLLSPYRLTIGLQPLLAKSAGARVVNVVSGGMYSQPLEVDKLQAPEDGYSGSVAYARAKRALMVVTEHWAEAWAGDNISVNAMHPGWAKTPGVEKSLPLFNKLTGRVLRSPEQGADTMVWLAVASEAGLCSGKLFLDREPRPTHLLPWTREAEGERQRLLESLDNWNVPSGTRQDTNPELAY